MRVLALVAEAFGGYGGIAQSTKDIICELSQSDNISHIEILPRQTRSTPEKMPEHVEQRSAVPGRLAYSAAAVSAGFQVRPAIVYCGHLFMVPLAALVARIHGAKLCVHLHGVELWSPLSRAFKLGLAQAHLVLCVSSDTRDRLLRATKIDPERVRIIYNTFSDSFRPGDRSAAREEFGLADAAHLLTVSRLDTAQRHKGHELVIAELARLHDEGRHVVYLIAGVGDDRERLETLAHEHGVSEHVRFLGQVTPDLLPQLYQAADLYVMPSTGEGFGIAFIEAMACGTPALGLAVGGAPDSLRHGELGMAVSVGEFPDALRSCLVRQWPDPELLSNAVYEHFGKNAFADRVKSAISPLVS